MYGIVELKGTNMIICDEFRNNFKIRSTLDFSVIENITNTFGELRCGLSFIEESICLLGIDKTLVRFDYQLKEILQFETINGEIRSIQELNSNLVIIQISPNYSEL